jgi:death-on-curing protein
MKNKTIEYPSEDQIVRLHDKLIKVSGGLKGTKSTGGIGSILQSMLYETQTLEEMSAYLLSRIIKSHVFVDGNKRTAYFGTRYFLLKNKCDLGNNNYKIKQIETIANAKNIHDAKKYALSIIKKEKLIEIPFAIDYKTFDRLIVDSIYVANGLKDL